MSNSLITVGSHQPTFLPYVGIFRRINNSDIFDFSGRFDLCTTGKDYYNLRVKVGLDNDWIYLNAPVDKKNFSSSTQSIQEVPMTKTGVDTLINKINGIYSSHYSKFNRFRKNRDYIYDLLKESSKFDNLADYNIFLITKICEFLGINTVISSGIKYSESSRNTSDRIMEQIWFYKEIESDLIYLSGNIGKTYLNRQKFSEAGIDIKFDSDFEFNSDESIKTVSILSYLFKYDPDDIMEMFLTPIPKV